METVWILLRVLVMSAVVAGLAYVTAGLVRQRSVRMQRGTCLEVIDAVALGSRHHLALVRAGSKVLCIGVSVEGLRPVAEFSGTDAEELMAQARRADDDRGAGGELGRITRRFRSIFERKLDDGERGGR